jgi:hypothetical protein
MFQRKFSRGIALSARLFGDFIHPWAPARMADVDDPRFSGFDAPIDQIWVSPDRKYTRLLDLGKASNLWMAADQRKGLVHGSFDVSCTLPAVFVKVIEEAAQIIPRTRR